MVGRMLRECWELGLHPTSSHGKKCGGDANKCTAGMLTNCFAGRLSRSYPNVSCVVPWSSKATVIRSVLWITWWFAPVINSTVECPDIESWVGWVVNLISTGSKGKCNKAKLGQKREKYSCAGYKTYTAHIDSQGELKYLYFILHDMTLLCCKLVSATAHAQTWKWDKAVAGKLQ